MITWAITADFDRNGSYETDLTDDVEAPGSGVTIRREFDRNGVYMSSAVTIDLSNRAGTYSYGNTASALAGKLLPRVPVRVTATYAAVTYTAWTGYLQSVKVSGLQAGKTPVATLNCTDLAGLLGASPPIDVTASARTTAEAYTAIVAAISGMTTADAIIGAGQTSMPLHWVRAQDALTAIGEVNASELGGSWFVDALGQIQTQGRNARTGLAGLADTWGDGTSVVPRAVAVEIQRDDVIDSVSVQCTVLVYTNPTDTVFIFSRNASNPTPDSLSLRPGEIYEVSVNLLSPVTALVTQVSGTDYTANTAIDGTGTDRSSSLGVTLTLLGGALGLRLVNNHASDTVYITKFEVSGLGAGLQVERPIFTYALALPGSWKVTKGASLQVPFVDDQRTVRDYAVQLLRTYRYPLPVVTAEFLPSNATAIASLLGLELGDLIRYTDTAMTTHGSYSDDWYYVDGIALQIPPTWAGQTFGAKVRLVPSHAWRRLDRICWDLFDRADASGSLGTSDQGKAWFGGSGFDIVSEKARANTDSESVALMDCGTGAFDLRAEVILASIGTGDEVGLVFRYQGANDHYRCYVDKGDSKVHLERVNGGVVTEITAPAYTVGTGVELAVMVQGSRIRVWLDQIPYIDTTNSSITTGSVCGLWARNASGTTTFAAPYWQGLSAVEPGPMAAEDGAMVDEPRRWLVPDDMLAVV